MEFFKASELEIEISRIQAQARRSLRALGDSMKGIEQHGSGSPGSLRLRF